VVARPGLGTINHTLLTLDAARVAGLDVAGVVLTNWPDEPGELELSNLATIRVLGGIPVTTLGTLYTGPPINPAGDLPVDAWLARSTVGAGRLSRPPTAATARG
jgi:dethiobiotin synthetase